MPYFLSRFQNLPGVFHIFSTVADGNMSAKWGDPEIVVQNRKKFLEHVGVQDDHVVMMSLVHGADIKHVGRAEMCSALDLAAPLPEVDALMTAEKGVYLAMLTADCLPVLYYDPKKSVIALAHCGWKSTEQKLAEKVVHEMVRAHGSDPADILVGFGPSIFPASYIFNDPIQKNLPGWEPFLKDLSDGTTSIDVIGYNKAQLIRAGIREDAIELSDVDTAISPNMFSHYRSVKTGEPEGRFLTLLGMPLL